MAYVEIEKVLETARNGYHSDFGRSMADLTSLQEVLEDTPTADVVEVKHGEWKHKRATIDGEHYFCCSECGREVSVNIYDNPSVTKFYPYCHCGAKMDGTPKERGGEK